MKQKTYRAASVRSASFDADENTIEVVWSTGADVVREDWDGPYIERLLMGPDNVRLDRLNQGAPFLNSHSSDNLSDVIGSVVPGSARIEGGKGLAKIRLSSAICDADVVAKIKEGTIRNISVGYWTHASERTEGAKGEPPIVTVTDWEPLEISAVPIPADAGAQIRSASGRRKGQTPQQRAAAYARGLLHPRAPTPSQDERRAAAEASRLLGRPSPLGCYRMESAPTTRFDKLDVERGACEARKLLGKAQ